VLVSRTSITYSFPTPNMTCRAMRYRDWRTKIQDSGIKMGVVKNWKLIWKYRQNVYFDKWKDKKTLISLSHWTKKQLSAPFWGHFRQNGLIFRVSKLTQLLCNKAHFRAKSDRRGAFPDSGYGMQWCPQS
jgi:hypothetical protein